MENPRGFNPRQGDFFHHPLMYPQMEFWYRGKTGGNAEAPAVFSMKLYKK
jgi:hypothetical protein